VWGGTWGPATLFPEGFLTYATKALTIFVKYQGELHQPKGKQFKW
jgi:hypothetical protein